MSDIPNVFGSTWYDEEYFKGEKGGKKFRRANGSLAQWSYYNPDGWWEGCRPIAKAWKTMFNPKNMLDVGAGRGAFIVAAREVGIEACGFDFSEWAVSNPCPRCQKEWLILHDATKPWPYKDKSFDLVVALDFYEHLYLDDIPFVVDEMYRVAKKWIFLQIAVVGGGSGYAIHEKGYILRRGEPVPRELEGNLVAGHVTVCPSEWWLDKLDREDVIARRDMVEWFYVLTPEEVTVNWRKNLVLVLEKLE
jgi:hypothetical protein